MLLAGVVFFFGATACSELNPHDEDVVGLFLGPLPSLEFGFESGFLERQAIVAGSDKELAEPLSEVLLVVGATKLVLEPVAGEVNTVSRLKGEDGGGVRFLGV